MTAGTRFSIGLRPQTMITNSAIRYARPNVNRISPTWPCLCTWRSPKRSIAAPSAPTTSGAMTSAGQKPMWRPIWNEKYAPSMNMLACAKLSTPIMLQMSVRPDDSMNSSSP